MSTLTQRRSNWFRPELSGQSLLTILSYVPMLILAVATIGPFLIMLSVSLRPNYTFLVFPISLIPDKIGLDNFVLLFNKTLVHRWLLNSAIVASTVVISDIITASMAGYAFARGNFWGRDLLFWAFMGILMVPGTVRLVPLFIMLSKLGWVNSYQGLILPHATTIFGTFMLRQYYTTIPRDYDDAALIDGASIYQIYSRVLFPQITPAIAMLGTLRFLEMWNDFMYPLLMTSRNEMRTLAVGLGTMARQDGAAGFEMAGAVLAFLPTFLVYLFAQRYLVQGIALSGIKA